MKIKNIGKARYSGGVELQPPDTTDVIILAYGDVADVPDKYGAALCAEQPDSFEEVTEPKKGGKS